MISTIYHFEFPAQLSANNIRLFSKSRTTEVTWTAELPEKFENAIFGRIFQIPAIE